MPMREQDLKRIANALSNSLRASVPGGILAEGDSLSLLKQIPDRSVSLILTDPPYHATQKKNIYGDTRFKQDRDYLSWMELYCQEWHRVLRKNGSLFCFCDSSMASRLEITFSERFNILSQIVWTKPNEPGFDGWKGKMKKEALRQWYPHSERIIFAEPAVEGNLHRSTFAHFLRDARIRAGLSQHELTASVGAYGQVNHGGAVSNWEAGRNTSSREQYAKICSAILETERVREMPPYEDAIRPFSVNSSEEFTDIWTFQTVRPYKGKHPAEKPLDMLEHAIKSTTYPGDIVLDCFAGSGSTAIAALNVGRQTVSLEIDKIWVDSIASRLKLATPDCNLSDFHMPAVQREQLPHLANQLDLFSPER